MGNNGNKKSIFERREDLLQVLCYHENIDVNREKWLLFSFDLETTSWRYKFPNIYNKYRTGINPVVAYYNELQKVKFTLKRTDSYRKWVESIVKHKDWKGALHQSIKNDINSIDVFLGKNGFVEEAVYLKMRLIDCLRTFK